MRGEENSFTSEVVASCYRVPAIGAIVNIIEAVPSL
jgi:hypothetical protein